MINLAEEIGLSPKRKASTNGGEYACSCPFCSTGKDRFLIWPSRSNANGEYRGGRYLCRVCGQYGDAITFLIKCHDLSYKEACKKLSLEPKRRNSSFIGKKELKFPLAKNPPILWQEKANIFVQWCHSYLIKSPRALELLAKRGFTLESVHKFKLGFNPTDFFRERDTWGLDIQKKEDGTTKKLWLPKGIIIPTFWDDKVIKVKARRSDWQEGDKLPKYIEISGSKPCPSIYGNQSLESLLVIESELDALLVQQFAGDLLYCIALGGSSKPLDLETYNLVNKCPTSLFLPDFDLAGRKAWEKWQKLFNHLHRILTPLEKSAGDAYLSGVDLRQWLVDCITESIRKRRSRLWDQ